MSDKVIIHFDVPRALVDKIDELAAGELLTRTAWLRRVTAKAAGALQKECAA